MQRSFARSLRLAVAAVVGILSTFMSGLSAIADDAVQPEKTLPIAGEVIRIERRTAFVIAPQQKLAGRQVPWVWYAPTLPNLPGSEERWMFERFTKAGIAIAGIDVGESFGSPDGRKLYTEFYRELTEKRGFSSKPVLLGRSRGGLMTLGWAVENADKVGGFAGIYPVCNIASYPGLARACGAYGLTETELTAKLREHNPLDRLAALAKARVPLFAIHGDVDKVVPLEANSGEVRQRYEKLGGEMQLMVPAGQGHNMWPGFFQSQELVDFVIAHATRPVGGPMIMSAGKSEHVIYCDPTAAAWVLEAAKEIQRVLKVSTGVELPIVREPAAKMISLGENDAARSAGVTLAAEAADDSFVLRTVGESLFIVGRDRADVPGWSSRGSLYGAYEFLESLGVRWLMPGEWGEEIPRRESLSLPQFDEQQSPAFFARVIQDVQDRRPKDDKRPSAPKLWLQRQKIPSTLDGWRLSAGHAWDDYITREQAEAHPEWLAKDSAGKPRRFANHKSIKFCTQEPALIEAFADSVIRTLDGHPERRCASISASDGGDFCQCDKCRPLIATDPHGRPSYSTLIVRFYDEVARRVAVKHPQRPVCGLVYYNYMYPPTPESLGLLARPESSKGVESNHALRKASERDTLSENLWLDWAPLNYYGWGLAKPVYRDEFARVAASWRAITPNFAYHNYSTWMRSFNGAPLPVGRDILKLELPAAHQAGARAVNMVGFGAWGYGAPTNYILAKQMWNPRVDVEQLHREWLRLAYGPGWESMAELNRLLESRLMDYKAKESPVYRGQQYEVNHALISAVHLPIFTEMERLYLAALAKTETEPQRRRLEMFGDNLIVLHHDLCQAGLLTEPTNSTFFRDDESYQKFLAATEFSLSLYRTHDRRFLGPIWKGEWRGE